MLNDIQKSAESKMQRSLEVLKENLAKVRTGRAHTGLLDQVEVDYYGSSSSRCCVQFGFSQDGQRNTRNCSDMVSL